jgi:hypothetical protein
MSSPRQVYYREWLAHFDDYWTFRDPVAGACHAGVVLTHHLSDEGAAALRNSGVPILVQVRGTGQFRAGVADGQTHRKMHGMLG